MARQTFSGTVGALTRQRAPEPIVPHLSTAVGVPDLSGWRTQVVLLTLAAFVIRVWQFGNPVIQADEQFYLLVGDRIWHGALPYLDIWDRKPLGLFLLYAAIRGLGGSGIIQYQFVATLFAAGTALIATRMARRIAPAGAAILAGILYMLCLGVSGGDGGQSPVFYNLPVAAAALIVLRVVERSPGQIRLVPAGLAAMGLIGLALQIKESCVFEGMFLGLTLTWLAWRARFSPAGIALAMLAWIAIAVLPSVLAWGWYAAHHHRAEYDFANFTSVFLRAPTAVAIIRQRLFMMAMHIVPLLAAGWFGWSTSARDGGPTPAHRFLVGWAAAALTGVLLFGTYFDHYALPLYAPLAVLAAPTLAMPRRRTPGLASHVPPGMILLLIAAIVSIHIIHKNREYRGDGQQQVTMAAYLRPRLHDCLFVFDGEPMLYYLTGSCLPTRWGFPDHLADGREENAIGIDPLWEARRVMAGRPRFVVTSDRPFEGGNMRTWRFIADRMRRDYRPVLAEPVGKRVRLVFERMATK